MRDSRGGRGGAAVGAGVRDDDAAGGGGAGMKPIRSAGQVGLPPRRELMGEGRKGEGATAAIS